MVMIEQKPLPPKSRPVEGILFYTLSDNNHALAFIQLDGLGKRDSSSIVDSRHIDTTVQELLDQGLIVHCTRSVEASVAYLRIAGSQGQVP